VCNTICLVGLKILNMHPQMTRLYAAAKTLRGINTQTELARALNLSSQTVNNWEARGISKPGMLAAQATIGCSATWLDSGEGEMILSAPELPPGVMQVVAAGPDDPYTYGIPRVHLRLQAGIMGIQTEPDQRGHGILRIDRSWADRQNLDPKRLVAIQVKGESMEPALYEGDIVVINLADTRPVDGSVYAVNYEGEAVIKRLSRDVGEWWLTSDNTDQRRFHRKLCRNGECIIVGKVVRKESTHI